MMLPSDMMSLPAELSTPGHSLMSIIMSEDVEVLDDLPAGSSYAILLTSSISMTLYNYLF